MPVHIYARFIMGTRRGLFAAVLATGAGIVASPAQAQDAAAGRAVFQSQCSICHSVKPGQNMIGPSLSGVVGRPAGQIAGFHYSAANKSSGLTWDEATLERYLANPRAVVPKTSMSYAGLKEPEKRANLIAYLATAH